MGLWDSMRSMFTRTAPTVTPPPAPLAFVDDGAAAKRTLPGLPRASADTVVDADLAAESIQKQLITLEQTASQRGQALGSAFAYPLTLEVANRWAAGLAARGYQLAPVSALTRR